MRIYQRKEGNGWFWCTENYKDSDSHQDWVRLRTTEQKLNFLLGYFASISEREGVLILLEDADILELIHELDFVDSGQIAFYLQGLESRGLIKTRISGSGIGASVTIDGYLASDEIAE